MQEVSDAHHIERTTQSGACSSDWTMRECLRSAPFLEQDQELAEQSAHSGRREAVASPSVRACAILLSAPL